MDDWDRGSAEEPSAWLAVTQPEFPRAARALARNMLLACEENTSLCIVFKDAGTYMTAMSAMYLHGVGGLTLSRLKDICARSGLLSSGRARSLLQVLTHIAYLRPIESARATIYEPTPAFVEAWRRHLQLAMLAAAIVEPSLALLCDRLETPAVFEALVAVQATRLHRLARGPDLFPALRRAFLHPYAGSQILWTLSLAGDDPGFPPQGLLPISLGQMAARFGVTRMHVRRVLAGAEREGLLQYRQGGAVVFLDAGLHSVRLHFAVQIAELIGAGLQVSGSIGRGGREHF